MRGLVLAKIHQHSKFEACIFICFKNRDQCSNLKWVSVKVVERVLACRIRQQVKIDEIK